jgi:hypothetical protein
MGANQRDTALNQCIVMTPLSQDSNIVALVGTVSLTEEPVRLISQMLQCVCHLWPMV